MSQMFSIILAIVMAFSSIGGMTAAQEGPVSFDAKISVDAQSIMQLSGAAASTETAEQTQQTMKLVEDILNAITLKGTADGGITELALYAGDAVLLSIGVKNNEDGALLASTLLGDQVVSVSEKYIQMMQQQMMQSMAQGVNTADAQALLNQLTNLDREQMTKDSYEIRDKIAQAIDAKKGEAETGEFMADGMAFTAKAPVDMTYTELMELSVTGIKELLAKESYQPIVQAFSQGEDINAKIDEALEELKKQPEEEKPELQLTVYTNEAQESYYACDMTRKPQTEAGTEEKLYYGFGKINSLEITNVSFDMNGQKMAVNATITEDWNMVVHGDIAAQGTAAVIDAIGDAAGGLELLATITAQGTDMKLHMSSIPAEDGRFAYAMEMYFGNGETPIFSLTGSAGKGGETVSAFEGENITELPIEKLADTEDATAASQMTMMMAAKLMGAISTLAKQLPEDSAAMLNALVKQMMNPGSTQTVPVTND